MEIRKKSCIIVTEYYSIICFHYTFISLPCIGGDFFCLIKEINIFANNFYLSKEETQPVKVGFLYLLLNDKMETIIQSIIQLINVIKNAGRRTILTVIFLLILSAITYILVTNFSDIIDLIKQENKQEIPTYNEYNYNPKQEEIRLDIPTINLLNRFFYTHDLVQELTLINLRELDINQPPIIEVLFELCRHNDSHFQLIDGKESTNFTIFKQILNAGGNEVLTNTELRRIDRNMYAIISNIDNVCTSYYTVISLDDSNTLFLIACSSTTFHEGLNNDINILCANLYFLIK